MSDKTLDRPINLADFEIAAREKLVVSTFDYYDSGAGDEITLKRNRQALNQMALLPRVLVDVSKRDTTTTVLGERISSPILVAPMAFHALAHPDGEAGMARAAAKFGTIMAVSTISNYSIEEVAAQPDAKLWFQLYVFKDRGICRALMQRAEAAGYKALVITVDAPLLGFRERDARNKFQLPPQMRMGNFMSEEFSKLPADSGSGLYAYFRSMIDAALTWKDLEWFVSNTKLPVLVKGVLRADDAVRAIEYGAKGIVVSNHGGRQLDTAITTIEALPAIAQAVSGKMEILLDGGIRRGTDVIKAIALGAKAVLVGRPLLWGLTCEGEHGAKKVLDLLHAEFDLAMALSGCASVDAITSDLVSQK